MESDLWSTFDCVRLSVRYHERREGFLESWHNATTGISTFMGTASGTAALVGIKGTTSTNEWGTWPFIAAGLAFVVAAVSAFDLAIGAQRNAKKHHDLRKQFLMLEADIFAERETSDSAVIAKFERRRLLITADESPQFHALSFLCENELARASGEGDRYVVPWFLRWTAQLWRWSNFGAKAADVVQKGDKAKGNAGGRNRSNSELGESVSDGRHEN